ncbi:MAG: TRAP transporter permease [Alphaproteobacteria bacterium]|nr:TRAP transporter permease [Alphaproteobacteria bacterium]MBM3628434.1 TRAP transporter permease [Alphaproteobacteria bacterium]
MTAAEQPIDERRARQIEEEFEAERPARQLAPALSKVLALGLVLFAIYHYVTAGTGIPVDYWHMGIHLSGVLVALFVLYPRAAGGRPPRLAIAGVPLSDWALGLVGAASALWIGFSWEGFDFTVLGHRVRLAEQAMRQGDPATIDIVLGTALIAIVLEATRRVIGWVLPIIVMVFVGFALFGPYMPFNILKHPGVHWGQFVNNVYFPAEGIFGIPLWVVSTVVFHFVLFGAVAQKMGLGRLFVDLSTVVAGRFVGGPAKVSVVSSALFGTISGSAVANVVSTGSLTIPNMKRLGYPGHFAGGVEAAASAGGQVTPPIMGAAAFIMAEYLALPYSTIALAATVPALMHYLGVLVIVHFEAKRLGLSGERAEDIPRLGDVLRRGWPSAIPLGVLLYVLFSGYTAYMAAFWGITACIVIGLVNPMHRMTPRQLFDAFLEGGRSALAVGAICAAVGIVIAVITLTGLAFRMGFMVTSAAQDIARGLHAVLAFVPGDIFTLKELTRFLSMLFIGIACLLMGAGVPTTALYIMLVTVAQPAFTNLGIPPLATHLFVLYYGIISEVTPPVCTSAYAAAAIANSNPWKTGFAAFRLSNAKIMVPFVFCYSPAMLIVLPGTTWADFLQTTLTCAAGVFVLGMAFTGYVNRPIAMALRLLLGFAGLMLVVPGTYTDLLAVAIVVPILGWLLLSGRKGTAARAG